MFLHRHFTAVWRGLILLVGLACAASAFSADTVRIALVIGNAEYSGVAALKNPVNDARAVSAELRRLGFSVIELLNASKAEMAGGIANVRSALAGKRGIGVLYYAGHGLQHDWKNYLVPVDFKVSSKPDDYSELVDLNGLLDAFRSAGNRISIVILDACRDNPFGNQLATRGLAPLDAPPGTFAAFATAPGHVALDGDGESENGLFTQFLLQELRKPRSRVEDLFQRVKLHVRQQSGGRQIPADSSNLDEDFSFDSGFARREPEREAGRTDRFKVEKQNWDRIKASSNPSDYYAFLQQHPSGFISEIAQFRLDQLEQPTLRAQGRQTLQSGLHRFATGDSFVAISTDLLTGVSRQVRQEVTLANDQRVEINGGATVYDQMGSLISDDSGLKEPPIMLVPTDLWLGRRWSATFENLLQGVPVRAFVDMTVVAFEDIDIPGARFKAYRVDMRGSAEVQGFSATVRGTLWIEPKAMRLIRYDRVIRGSTMILDSTRQTFVDYRPASRAP